ncbi:MAG: M14 metallopeptidase family protein, partial [Balneolaceae bacterium]
MNLKKPSLLLLIALFIASPQVYAQTNLQSPEEFLGYELGDRWTPHYKVLEYVNHVAEASPLVELEPYGETNEGRKLVILKIASENKQGELEDIRLNNLRRIGLAEGEPGDTGPAIVWLSYNVHGNETSSSEAAMKTLYELVRPDNDKAAQWLENTVVIMDPMLNPDGRDRYVNWYRSVAGDRFNPEPEAREHEEPWPGGRTNHYYFDLNRDWAWLTQKESRQRLAKYREWMPHIHVDFHEQSYNAPYYFAPAAEPFHRAITGWQRDFQHTIGDNHARYFDKNNWLYFTRQVFDLFYPSYGDTYPTFNGAIGMTYEQAGGGSAGLGIITAEGDTLTLSERLTHHHTTGLSTVEVASDHAEEIVRQFELYYQTNRDNPEGEYRSFIIKKDSHPDKLRSLLELLDQHEIKYGQAGREEEVDGYSYRTGANERVTVEEGDFVVNTAQPKSVLARVLFEPDPELSDSLTYDITAWEQHYAFGVEGFATGEEIETVDANLPAPADNAVPTDRPYAYLAEWSSLQDLQLLSKLLTSDVHLRYAKKPFTIDGKEWKAGTLIITRIHNKHMGTRFDDTVIEAANETGQQLTAVSSGRVEEGPDFGSRDIPALRPPKIALLSGEATSAYRVGEIWHFFNRQINYPVSLLDSKSFSVSELDDFDLFILPEGSYNDLFDEHSLKRLQDWITDGGRLFAVGEANSFLAGKNGFLLKPKENEMEPETAASGPNGKLLTKYRDRNREQVTHSTPGSIFRITMDNSHPLAFGYEEEYFSLKLNADAYRYLDGGWNVGTVQSDAHISGFAGYQAQKNLQETLTFGVQEMGRGSVIYLVDNPL